MEYPLRAEPENPGRRGTAGGRRQTGVWLAIAVLMLALAGQYMLQRHQLQELQGQLVATQESFAGLGEDSLQHLQQLDERTAGLGRLQGRVLGMSELLGEVSQQVGQLAVLTDQVQALQAVQGGLQQQLPGLAQQLDEQSQGVEQVALALDAAQQRLQTEVVQQGKDAALLQQELSAALGGLQASVHELQEQSSLDRQQLEVISGQLAEKEVLLATLADLPERHGQLQQSLLRLAQQVEAERQGRQELSEEMSAFRLQMTRALDRLQQRLDAVQP